MIWSSGKNKGPSGKTLIISSDRYIRLSPRVSGFKGSVFYVWFKDGYQDTNNWGIYMGMDKLTETLVNGNIPIPDSIYEKWDELTSMHGGFKGALELNSLPDMPLEKRIMQSFLREDKLNEMKKRYQNGDFSISSSA